MMARFPSVILFLFGAQEAMAALVAEEEAASPVGTVVQVAMATELAMVASGGAVLTVDTAVAAAGVPVEQVTAFLPTILTYHSLEL